MDNTDDILNVKALHIGDVSKRYCKFCTHRTTIDLKGGSPINYCPKNKMLVRNDTNGCNRMELGKHKIAYVFNVC